MKASIFCFYLLFSGIFASAQLSNKSNTPWEQTSGFSHLDTVFILISFTSLVTMVLYLVYLSIKRKAFLNRHE